jgi:hypothetical protein
MAQDYQKKSENKIQATAANANCGNTAIQLKDNREHSDIQQKLAEKTTNQEVASSPIQTKKNVTGLPDNLKSGIENLSGHSMDDVKLHYNSDKPAQLNAHAYAQGTDIHLASGQEKHLPHEAWHVVQQKQGRVKPTIQMKGNVNVNDDKGLENEADIMGVKAMQNTGPTSEFKNRNLNSNAKRDGVIQGYFSDIHYNMLRPIFIQHVTKFITEVYPENLMMQGVLNQYILKVNSENNEGTSNDFLESYGISTSDVDHYAISGEKTTTISGAPLKTGSKDLEESPKPLLRGIIWNLHGFTNVISSKDTSELKVTGGKRHKTRESLVQDILGQVAGINTKTIETHEKTIKKEFRKQLKNQGKEGLSDLLNQPLSETQIKKILKFISPKDLKLPKDFLKKIKGTEKYQMDDEHKDIIVDALKEAQEDYEPDSKEYLQIDIIINHLQATELVKKFIESPNYVSNLIKSLQKIKVQELDKHGLISLIDKVKELRSIIKSLSVFEHKDGKSDNALQNAFYELDKTLNMLINRNKSSKYLKDDQNLAVYLDKELNKFGIVSHIIYLLNNPNAELDFMLLNEMNQGINSFSHEVATATNNKYQVVSGPQMAARTQENKPSQREYYPLVYNTKKFDYVRLFYVGLKKNKVFTESRETIDWMKPEKKKKQAEKEISDSTVKTSSSDSYFDYRPIVVHIIRRKEEKTDDSMQEENPEIWLAVVHTTPYGSEFDRKKIYEELQQPLAYLKKEATSKKARLIIGGDFYIAAESVVKSTPQDMLQLTTPEKRKRSQYKYEPTKGSQNETRNLRDKNRVVYNFTKSLSGDKDPISGEEFPSVMELQDSRSITGTNRNSSGLQSADYFIVPSKDKDHVRVGLIDPKTGKIVELETEDQQISRHDLRLSDHVISAIELYDSPKSKKQAQLGHREHVERTHNLYIKDLENIHEDPKSKGYGYQDYEPQPGLSSLITTYLYRIYELILHIKPWEQGIMVIDLPNGTETVPEEYKKLLENIELLRQELKAKTYIPALYKEKLNELLAAINNIEDETILEYSTILHDLISNYLEPDKSPVSKHETQESDSLDDWQESSSAKKYWGAEMNYPKHDELDTFLQVTFHENLLVSNLIENANCDAKALEVVLQTYDPHNYNQFLADMWEREIDIDDPITIKELSKLDFTVYIYTVGFFEEDKKFMVNAYKKAYGKGSNDIRILHISSGLLKPPFLYSGYYLIGRFENKKKITMMGSTSVSVPDDGIIKSGINSDSKASSSSGLESSLLPLLDFSTGQSESGMQMSEEHQNPVDESYRERLNLQIESATDSVSSMSQQSLVTLTQNILSNVIGSDYGTNEYLIAYLYLLKINENATAQKVLSHLENNIIPKARLFHTWEVDVEQAQEKWANEQDGPRGVIWREEMKQRTKLAKTWYLKYENQFGNLDSAQQKIILEALTADQKAQEEAEEIQNIKNLFQGGKQLTDGNCLFAALIPNNDDVSLVAANMLRLLVTQYLSKSEVEQTPFNELRPYHGSLQAIMLYTQLKQRGITLETYQKYMKISGVWAGDPEINAFSRIHGNITIYIMEPGTIGFRTLKNGHNQGATTANQVIQEVKAGNAIAISSSGGHYRRLLPKNEFMM